MIFLYIKWSNNNFINDINELKRLINYWGRYL